MIPSERAEELYLKYKAALNIQNDMRPGKNPFAIQCAIICVEQIIAAFEIVIAPESVTASTRDGQELIGGMEYWQEVLSILKNNKNV